MKLIAETAWHHDGDFNFFKNLVNEIVKKTQCDYVKFHITLNVNEYINNDHKIYNWVNSRIFKREQWNEIFRITENSGKKIMLLFNDIESIKFGMEFNPDLVEIHSTCLNDIKLLKYLSDNINKRTRVVIGVGGSELEEIDYALKTLKTKNIILMHGFQNYPTKYIDVNFNKIKRIILKYSNYEHGYADHTAWNDENNVLITLLGASLGMNYIEKHVTIFPGVGRVDWQAAVSIDIFNQIEKKLKVLKDSFGSGSLGLNTAEKSYSIFGPMKKAAITNQNLKKDQVLSLNHFDFKRTKQISNISQIKVIDSIGKKLKKDIAKGKVLLKKHLY